MIRLPFARGLALGLLLASVTSSAFAAYLVDTGTPNPTNPADYSTAPARGVQFVVTTPVTITSVEHYAAIDAPDDPNNPNDGFTNVRLFIRPQASAPCTSPFGDFPCPVGTPFDPSTDLFGLNFDVPNTYPAGPNIDPAPRWFGLSGINWVLGPGTYWVMRTGNYVFSPYCAANGGCTGFVGQTYEDSNALGSSTLWTPNGARTGWRVGIRAVPEPGTLALLGLGLAGLGLSRRRKAA